MQGMAVVGTPRPASRPRRPRWRPWGSVSTPALAGGHQRLGNPAQLQGAVALAEPDCTVPVDTRHQAVTCCTKFMMVYCRPCTRTTLVVQLPGGARGTAAGADRCRAVAGARGGLQQRPRRPRPHQGARRLCFHCVCVPWCCQESQPQLMRGRCSPPAATAASSSAPLRPHRCSRTIASAPCPRRFRSKDACCVTASVVLHGAGKSGEMWGNLRTGTTRMHVLSQHQ